eukprot:TRINITY_DN12510_c3_g1_i1.p1 TRINITY_DN12510_c3_g1~~TRINITY_DN12510_c3_g1_i1.p1  ORF type:complete len:541 (+),score=163.10 TRINITY_DN12510_c3_g1_i1:25-1623(+)
MPKILLVLALAGVAVAEIEKAGVQCTSNDHNVDSYSCSFVDFGDGSYSARVSVDKANYNLTGWGLLKLESNAAEEPFTAAYAAGYVEGHQTAEWIYYNVLNLVHEETAEVDKFVQTNWAFVKQQMAQNSSTYWQQVKLVVLQFEGMLAGYNDGRGDLPQVSEYQLLKLAYLSDLSDIRLKVDPSTRPNMTEMDPQAMKDYFHAHTHCSAIVKVNDDLTELWTSHDTWCSYSQMLRLYKTYVLPFNLRGTVAKTVMYSGYPGVLQGIDDFYVTDQNLTVLETTNGVFNSTLLDRINESTVMYWLRVQVANRMATNAWDWHEIFFQYNSGTYNNQWMIVDYKLFTPGQPLPPSLLVVSEQLPGYYHVEDQTMALQRGYWNSYNVPYYSSVYQMAGYAEAAKRYGDDFTYQLAPRAKIFRRDAGNIESLDDLKKFMRENNYGTGDPLADGTDHAIAARRDLDPVAPRTDGAIDCKIVSSQNVKAMSVVAIAGPTHEVQPVFNWTGAWTNATAFPHYGHPVSFDFDWVEIDQSSYD